MQKFSQQALRYFFTGAFVLARQDVLIFVYWTRLVAWLESCCVFDVFAIAKRFNNLFITFSLLLVGEILLVLLGIASRVLLFGFANFAFSRRVYSLLQMQAIRAKL